MGFIQKLLEKVRDKASQHGYVCDACGAEVFEYPTKRLCASCEEAMRKNDKLRCNKCGRRTRAEGVCLTCKRDMPSFTQGISPFVYRAETASLINRIKNGTPRLAYYFGERMAESLLAEMQRQKSAFDGGRYALNEDEYQKSRENPLVIPVPLTEKKEKIRGYNQAAELARVVARSLQQAGVDAELDTELLQKRRETQQQKQSSFQARRDNVEGAYHVHKRKACKGRTIILVDDIMTTGATGSECASRLLGAGAKEVLLVVAAALPEQQ